MSETNRPDERSAGVSRRTWVGVALAAGTLGAGASWWLRRVTTEPLDQALAQFWAQIYPDPQGAPLAMAAFQGRRLVINFWATWCPPCIEELPLLNQFHVNHHAKGWTVLGLAVDQAEPVQRFLKRQPLAFPVAVLGSGGLALTQSFGNAAGSLPYTAVVGTDGRWLHRKLGKVNERDLAAWAALP